jgi:DNA helicase-2/ATP-dependent DNA helicase PcrA
VSQRFPTNDRHEQIPLPEEIIKEVLPQGDYHLQEERRLFYVGMTRAKDLLYLTAADYYGEGKREKKLSQFIFEALGDEAVGSENPVPDSEQLSFLEYKPQQISIVQKASEPEPLHIDYLSYSQIEAFKICPLHYKLRYILRVPTPPSASQSFGSTIHKTLKDFYEELKVNKDMKKDNSKELEKSLLKIYENDWIKEGFSSKEHEQKFFEKGKIYLTGFLKHGLNLGNLPAALEQKFTIPLPYKEGERPLKVGGVMDRVDITNEKMTIVDYKTAATIPSQKEVDNNSQLSVYSLAASTLKDYPFNRSVKDISLSLYYFDQQEELTTVRNEAQLSSLIDDIYNVRRQIESSDFKCSGHIFCVQGCEYSMFCNSEN